MKLTWDAEFAQLRDENQLELDESGKKAVGGADVAHLESTQR